MSPRAAALACVVLSLALLGATVADWSVAVETRSFDVGDDPDGASGTIEIPQEETTSGARSAGGLLAVGLGGLVVAGLIVRFRWAAGATVVLAGVGAVVLVLGWPTTGTPTAAPAIAGIALLGYPAVGLAVLSRGRRADSRAANRADGRAERERTTEHDGDDPGAGDPGAVDAPGGDHRTDVPSRYTVEAVRGEVSEDEEWDMAVADDDTTTEDDQ